MWLKAIMQTTGSKRSALCNVASCMCLLQKLHVFADARNRFLRCWNFANRIPYNKGGEVEVLSDCLEELHGVVSVGPCADMMFN